MPITTISSRKFNQDISRAKKAANSGPVIITDRGRPAHVLLNIAQYQQITGTNKTIIELLAIPGAADIDFDPPRVNDEILQPADLS